MVSISRRLSTSKPCTKMVHHVNSVSRWETHWRFNNLVNMGLLWLVGIVFCSSSTFLLCTVHLNSQYLLVIFLFGVSGAVLQELIVLHQCAVFICTRLLKKRLLLSKGVLCENIGSYDAIIWGCRFSSDKDWATALLSSHDFDSSSLQVRLKKIKQFTERC